MKLHFIKTVDWSNIADLPKSLFYKKIDKFIANRTY